MFELFAKKNKVQAPEVDDIVRAAGFCPTQKQLAEAKATAGVSGTADLKQTQAVAAALASTKVDDTFTKKLSTALNHWDQDGAEVVTVSELSHALGSMGEKLNKDQIDEILRQAEVDGFGQISIEDFSAMMASEAGR